MQTRWRRLWFRGRVSRMRNEVPVAAHRGRGGQLLFSAVLGIGLAVLVISLFDHSMRPLVTEMAKVRASNQVTRIVNDAVNHTLSVNAIAYDDMISLQKDTAGQITALTSNSVEMNRLRGDIIAEIIGQVDTLDTPELGVPLGNLSGLSALSEKGPLLPVKILSAASAEAVFRNQFTSAGINQTYHQVMLDVAVHITLLIPGGTVETVVTTQVNVAETVIVGKVPDAYLQFGEQAK